VFTAVRPPAQGGTIQESLSMPKKILKVRLIALILAVFGSAAPAETGITSKEAKAIISELKQIRRLLEKGVPTSARQAPAQPSAPEKVKLNMAENAYTLGREDAPITLVEFSDYQCPFCRQYHIGTFDEIKKNFVDTGKVRYIHRDYPLGFHQNAEKAAIAARCAGEQDQFWPFRHVLIVNADKLTRDDLLNYARDMKLNLESFTACLDSDRFKEQVQRDVTDGNAVGVSGTPTFLIGKTTKAKTFDAIKLVGTQPYSFFESKLNELLQK
jgi:protein-disulfide isomerase